MNGPLPTWMEQCYQHECLFVTRFLFAIMSATSLAWWNMSSLCEQCKNVLSWLTNNGVITSPSLILKRSVCWCQLWLCSHVFMNVWVVSCLYKIKSLCEKHIGLPPPPPPNLQCIQQYSQPLEVHFTDAIYLFLLLLHSTPTLKVKCMQASHTSLQIWKIYSCHYQSGIHLDCVKYKCNQHLSGS